VRAGHGAGTGVQTARASLDAGDIGVPVAATAFMTTPGHERWHRPGVLLRARRRSVAGHGAVLPDGAGHAARAGAAGGRLSSAPRATRVIGSGARRVRGVGTTACPVPTLIRGAAPDVEAHHQRGQSRDGPAARITCMAPRHRISDHGSRHRCDTPVARGAEDMPTTRRTGPSSVTSAVR